MININEVKEYLRIDNNIEDGYLAILILLSKEICINYLRIEELPLEMPMALKQAMLLIISYFYENREGTKDGIPIVVYRLLDPYRKDSF